MGDKLDMSLDDIIKQGKKSKPRGGGRISTRGRGTALGGVMRQNRRNLRSNRGLPYRRPQQIPNKWQHDLFDGNNGGPRTRSGGGGGGGGFGGNASISTGTKLHISNLDFAVSESDIEELFREFGKMKRSCVHYDASGRSHGTAEVVYHRKEDAMNAIKQYNGIPLDGRPMKIEVVSDQISSRQQDSFSSQRRGFSGQSRARGFSRGRGRQGLRRARGGGVGAKRNPTKTAEELDAELDAYHDQGDVEMGDI